MENKMIGINMPELVLYRFFKMVSELIIDDFNNETDETRTMLYYLFGTDLLDEDIKLETFNYFEQAKRIIIKDKINIGIGYNAELAEIGCLHIMLPSENSDASPIGGNENYQEYLEITEDNELIDKTPVFTRTFDCNYNVLISSKNSLQAVVMYHFFKACIISLQEHLEFYGLQNMKLGGSDISMDSNFIPTSVYHRSLTLNFSYEVSIPRIFKEKLAKDFKLTGIILE